MKSIVIFSGGLDSTVILALALSQGRECHALSFDYNQKHKVELDSAKKICEYYQVPQTIIKIDFEAFNLSSLVGEKQVPQNCSVQDRGHSKIPTTYVPARNTLFIAYALGFAEQLNAGEIYYGANMLDNAGYPDCRPEYVEAFQKLINTATKQSIEDRPPQLVAPLIQMTKKDIVTLGKKLEAPLEWTFSCYSPEKSKPCQKCDACILRKEGFNG